jgi:glycosyltransferase involved in cell wall biosynthesis
MSRFNVGGTSQWLFQLSSGLSSQSVENLLVIGDCLIEETEDSRLQNINHLKIGGLGNKAGFVLTIRSFFQLRRVIKTFKPDIVNTHTSKAGVLGRLASKSVRGKHKSIHTYHGEVLNGYFSRSIVLSIQMIERFLALITDRFFVAGQVTAETLLSKRIINSYNYDLVWPGVPDYALGNRKVLRESLGISTNKIVVGWLGRKVKIKRIDRILDLAEQFPEVYFLIAGDGTSIKESFPTFFDGKKRSNVIELGSTSPSAIWAISDIALLTSDNEAIPISPIEASLANLPILATDVGSIREVVQDGVTGFICPSNIFNMVPALQILIDNEKLRNRFGSSARGYALKKFSPETFVSHHIKLYALTLNTPID